MTEDYERKFQAMAENMQWEEIDNSLADTAELARRVAMHAAQVYWAGRKAGLPRKVAEYMARDYWNIHMAPFISSYVIGE